MMALMPANCWKTKMSMLMTTDLVVSIFNRPGFFAAPAPPGALARPADQCVPCQKIHLRPLCNQKLPAVMDLAAETAPCPLPVLPRSMGQLFWRGAVWQLSNGIL